MNQRLKTRFAVAFAMAIIFVGCSSPAQESSPSELVYGLTLSPSGIDPHIHASSELGIPLRSVYDTLVYRDSETLDFVPGLAESWQISDDALTYTFDLRQDVTFHDGTPFNAEAVKTNIERILDPEVNSLKAAQLIGPVDRIDVNDDYTVSIVLSEPFAPLMDGLSQPYLGMASPQALEEWDDANYQFHQVGTGPYRFVEYIANDRLVLESNPDYTWGPSTVVNTGVPQVDRIVFHFFPDPATRALALESGEADIMGELLPTDARQLSEDEAITLKPAAVPGQPLQFFFNTQQPPTDNLLVRQALILATDREAIVQAVFQDYSPVAYGPLTAATLYYDPAIEGQYSYDPELATAYLEESGIDAAGTEIKLVAPPWGLISEVAQLLESQWEETLGFQVEIEQVASYPLLVEAAGSGDYHAISVHFSGLDPIVLNSFYLSDARMNWSGVADPELDRLLLEAQAEADPQMRADLYAQVQQQIMDEALILPIRDQVNLNASQPGVQGLHFDAQGWFPYLTDLSLEQ